MKHFDKMNLLCLDLRQSYPSQRNSSTLVMWGAGTSDYLAETNQFITDLFQLSSSCCFKGGGGGFPPALQPLTLLNTQYKDRHPTNPLLEVICWRFPSPHRPRSGPVQKPEAKIDDFLLLLKWGNETWRTSQPMGRCWFRGEKRKKKEKKKSKITTHGGFFLLLPILIIYSIFQIVYKSQFTKNIQTCLCFFDKLRKRNLALLVCD